MENAHQQWLAETTRKTVVSLLETAPAAKTLQK